MQFPGDVINHRAVLHAHEPTRGRATFAMFLGIHSRLHRVQFVDGENVHPDAASDVLVAAEKFPAHPWNAKRVLCEASTNAIPRTESH